MNVVFQNAPVRRLLLLVGVVASGLGVLGLRLADLTLRQGEELRRDAEERLVREQWLPTARGNIVDRKGRVLALDRPRYDVTVEYTVLSGEWAVSQARRRAIRSVGTRWADMSREERDALVERWTPLYLEHLERGFDRLAADLGVPREEVDRLRLDVVDALERRQEQIARARLDRALAAAAERGETITPARRRSLERDAAAPIAERRSPRVLIAGVTDDVGFRVRALAEEEARVDGPGAVDASGDAAGDSAVPGAEAGAGRSRVETAPVLPGLAVVDGGRRDYPLDELDVTLDTSTFPGPLRSGESSVRVEGLLCHVLGKLRDQVYPDREAEGGSAGQVIAGDATRRRRFLEQNPAEATHAFVVLRGEDRADRGAYREGDRVGDTGVEASQENHLRGLRGLLRTRLDTGERETLDPVHGRSVALTIDAHLQARVHALLLPRTGLSVVQPWHNSDEPTQGPGTHLTGAAVVLDIDTGEILAAVSTPAYTREQLERDPASVYQDELSRPFFNRALAGEYAPGSIVKPLVYVGAVQRGVARAGEAISCTGHYLPGNPNILRCLIWSRGSITHDERIGHPPNPTEAIGLSCNIFFYAMGERLGPAGVAELYRSLGVQSRFGLGGGLEAPGQLGAPGRGVDGLGVFDARLMGIGQGPLTWTPLHAAQAYATLARGGVWVPPRLMRDAPRETPRDLGWPQGAVREAMDGLDYAVNNPLGTGHELRIDGVLEPMFNVPGVRVWGKTGTAQAHPQRIDPDGDGPMDPVVVRAGEHSWFVVLAGVDKPRYAVSVVIEYGGSGGRVSGPIVNQVLHALRAEGYLGAVAAQVQGGQDGALEAGGAGAP